MPLGDRQSVYDRIRLMHASKHKVVLAVTGGGADVIGMLLRHGGGSATVLEVLVPYDQASLNDFLGGAPDKYCSAATSRQMAMASFLRAKQLAPQDSVIGVGATCSLARPGYSREIREDGTHRRHVAYVSFQSERETQEYTLELRDYERTREEEEDMVATYIVAAMFHFLKRIFCFALRPEDASNWRQVTEAELGIPGLKNVILGQKDMAIIGYVSNIIFPGSFNPCTKNHLEMAKIAGGDGVTMEMSVINADKPPMDYISIQERLATIPIGESNICGVALTNAPKFIQKSPIFPHSHFIVGADTLNRLCDQKYYAVPVETALQDAFAHHGFIVFPRHGIDVDHRAHDILGCSMRYIGTEEYHDDGHSSTKERKRTRSILGNGIIDGAG